MMIADIIFTMSSIFIIYSVFKIIYSEKINRFFDK